MRLTQASKQRLLETAALSRPGVKLYRYAGDWLVVWHVTHDALVDPTKKVAPASRWRAQVVVGPAGNGEGGGFWMHSEGHGKTKAQAIASAFAEAHG